MAVTEGDRFAVQVAGEAESGGPKRLAVDDDGQLKVVSVHQGIAYIATVTEATSTTQFKATALIGKGDSYFVGWEVSPVWDAGGAGAAPQNEHKTVSAFVSATGFVTHPVFTAQLAVGDKVMLIAPRVAKTPTYETISYSPGLKDTTDLEAATKTITRTTEASGVGNADYSAALTLTVPTDARLAILRIASRLSVTIDSDDGTHDLRCRVYVDSQDANHLLYDLTYSSTGNQLSVQDCLVGTKEVIFNLLKDGLSHTFYFFFWSPGNHSPVISVVELWEAVGTTSTSRVVVMRFTYTGLITPVSNWLRLGSAGAHSLFVCSYNQNWPTVAYFETNGTGTNFEREYSVLVVVIGMDWIINVTATDLSYPGTLLLLLRSD